jgi:hypothetical protein
MSNHLALQDQFNALLTEFEENIEMDELGAMLQWLDAMQISYNVHISNESLRVLYRLSVASELHKLNAIFLGELIHYVWGIA